MTQPLEYCTKCAEPTGRAGAGEDSLYAENGDGPFCEECWVEPAAGFVYDTSRNSEIDFGDYVLIEQHRYVAENEHYLHKVIGRGSSNTWVAVPEVGIGPEVSHDRLESVVYCICCGIKEDKVKRYLVADVRLKITKEEGWQDPIDWPPEWHDGRLLQGQWMDREGVICVATFQFFKGKSNWFEYPHGEHTTPLRLRPLPSQDNEP